MTKAERQAKREYDRQYRRRRGIPSREEYLARIYAQTHIEGVTGRMNVKEYYSDMTRKQREAAQEILRGLGKGQ